MNDKILSHDGGQPVFADDLTFLQNSLKSYINAIAKTYGDTYILHGVLDDSKTTIIPGAIVVNGVLYEVPALGEINGQKLCFKSVDYDPRVYENGSTHNVKNKVDVYLGNDTAGTIAYVEPATLKNIGGQIYNVVYGNCTHIDTSTGWEIKFEKELNMSSHCIVFASIRFKYGSDFHDSISFDFNDNYEAFEMKWSQLDGKSMPMEVSNSRVKCIYSRSNLPSNPPEGITDVVFFVVKL